MIKMKKRLLAVLIITLLFALYSYTQVFHPTQYKLYQNVPDPFDTTGTIIRFDILEDSAGVYIAIADIHGYLITWLTSNKFPAGEHQIYWNAKGPDSLYIVPGVYTCKMSVVVESQLAIVFRDSIHIHFQTNVGVQENSSINNPSKFRLDQNYPNPFNPSTNISFSLPTHSFVSLKVFDLLGREVASIASEELSAGNHTLQWNAINISSGIYFYRLQAGSFTETKKLILLQ